MNRAIKRILPLILVLPAALQAGEWDLTGYAGVNSRVFPDDSRLQGSHHGSSHSLQVQSEFYWQSGEGRTRFGAIGYGRRDSEDEERTHLDLRQASFGYQGSSWDSNIGVDKVFWGVTESRHLVDVINQTDLVEDIDEEDKLGQPMINLNLNRDFGRIELYLLPHFRERTFAGTDGRLRTPLSVASDGAKFESQERKRHKDVSLRYSHYIGNFDIGAYVFDGTSREPIFELADNGREFIPYYEQMTQFGVDLQLTGDALLWKFESIARDANSDSFWATVTGIEYTFFGAHGSAADVGVLIEYLYDSRNQNAPPTAFDHDLFLGTRLALNDVGDTSVLAGAVFDTRTRGTFVNVEATRRFGDSLSFDARLRLFGNAEPSDPGYWLEDDDYLEISLSWYY